MGLNQVPKEVRELYRRRELGPDRWFQWSRLEPTQELVKALRLEELSLRYAVGELPNDYDRARADGLLKAIQIIERFTKVIDTGEE